MTDLDFGRYVKFATRMKTAPAFDSISKNTPGNELFGTSAVQYQHFTEFGKVQSL
ncbi:MAG TPA: hypothetical protein GXX75_20935 [Clostridiales bacterium]|nr:hypothetical protein [Clostridiales bacterium]